MKRRTWPRILTIIAVLTMVAAVIGFVISLVLNVFFFDEYDAYGEAPIPGTSSIHLPAGEVSVTFHTELIGSTSGSGLPVPPLKYRIEGPAGVAEPQLIEDYGHTTTVNNDARVRLGHVDIAVDGDYEITVDGNVGAYLSPRLAFGHGSDRYYLLIVFAVIFALAVVGLIVARVWAARARRREPREGPAPSFAPIATAWPAGAREPAGPMPPTDQGVRIEQLNTLARLRDSGALTEAEYTAEKKRVLDGL